MRVRVFLLNSFFTFSFFALFVRVAVPKMYLPSSRKRPRPESARPHTDARQRLDFFQNASGVHADAVTQLACKLPPDMQTAYAYTQAELPPDMQAAYAYIAALEAEDAGSSGSTQDYGSGSSTQDYGSGTSTQDYGSGSSTQDYGSGASTHGTPAGPRNASCVSDDDSDDKPLSRFKTPSTTASRRPARAGLTSSDEKFACETASGWYQEGDCDEADEDCDETDDDWDPLLMTTHCPKATRARNANNAQYRCLSKDGRPETDVRLCSNEDWDCSPSKHKKSTCIITSKTGKRVKYSVPKRRALKAMKLMSPSNIQEVVGAKSCNCRRKCNEHLTVAMVQTARLTVAQCESEHAAGDKLCGLLRAHTGRYMVGDREVCQRAFCAAYGASADKLRKCMQIAKAPVTALYPSERLSPLTRAAKQETLCISFWTHFFDRHCQRPNDHTRLFPIDKTMENIHKDHFVRWCGKRRITGEAVPSLTTLKRARWHPNFADVQRLKHHNHARCSTCSNLKAEMLKADYDGEEFARVRQLQRVHDTSITAWRRLEDQLKSLSRTNPDEVIVIWHDGTQALGFPRCTNRPPKNLTKSRFNWIPWLAHDAGRDRYEYIYMPKDRWACDANYLITMLQAIVHRAKSDYTNPQYKARRIVFVADNAGENKNNELLAWATELVSLKLFDEVEFLFGEVGHTHNGVDAAHKIHNADVGKVFSGDIGHFVYNYDVAFHKNVPNASILTQVYDFKRYYAEHMNRLAGFTKTPQDPAIVRGWKVMRNAKNKVEIRWKVDPALEEHWRGVLGDEHSPGFQILKSVPTTFPQLAQPSKEILSAEYLTQLKCPHMKETLLAQELLPCVKWNYDGAKNGGVVPMEPTEDDIPKGEWGKLHLVGAIQGKQGGMRAVERIFGGTTRQTMFSPAAGENNEQDVATGVAFHFSSDGALRDGRPLPCLRYAAQSAKKSPLYTHPNNQVHRELAKLKKAALDAHDSASDAEDEHEQEAPDAIGGDAGDAASVAAGGDAADGGAGAGGDAADGGSYYMEQGDQYFEVDFRGCKVGHFFVSKVRFENGQEGLNLGKVANISDAPKRSFTAVMFECTKPNNTRQCITAAWHPRRGDGRKELIHNWQVMTYFDKLTAQHKLRKKYVDFLVEGDQVRWYEPQPDGPGDNPE